MIQAEKDVMKLFDNIGKSYGMDSLISNIISIIYLEPEPVCLNEIAKRTGYSLASISNKIKKIELFTPIRRVRKPGSKKVYLFMEKEMFKVFKTQMQKHREIKILPLKKHLPPIIKDYKKQAKTDKDKKKVKILEQYNKDVEKFDTIMSKMLKRLEGSQ
jgi:DNA-binding transcriptional regulator GbsR (MarR family)